MLSELFWIVMSCKIATSSMKIKFIHKIAFIQKFLLLFNLLQGPDNTFGGRRSARCASRLYGVHFMHQDYKELFELSLLQPQHWITV